LSREELEELLVRQTSELQQRHPNLELQRDGDGRYWVRGGVGFSITHNGHRIIDSYKIELAIPFDYPERPPRVFENDGKVPRDFEHFLEAGDLCLEAPVEVKRRFAVHRDLLHFVDEQVIPYLFACSYKKDVGSVPFGERSHGELGLLEYYREQFGTSGIPTLKLLRLLADGITPAGMACPCGSSRSLADCHGPKVEELRQYQHPRMFEAELRAIVRLARLAKADVPTDAVFSKRMLKRERRLRRKKR